MELINSFLDLCVSLSCVFAIALAYQATKEIERVDKRVDHLSGEFDEVAGKGGLDMNELSTLVVVGLQVLILVNVLLVQAMLKNHHG